MLVSIVLAVLAIRRRDISSHGAWMTRGYAIALGAGTQVFTMLPWVIAFGPIGAADELPRTVLMTPGAWFGPVRNSGCTGNLKGTRREPPQTATTGG